MSEVKKKKFRLSGMTYDEVSLVDSGANQHAHVLIFKRDVSKGILTPEDVHTPVPVGTEKRPRKGKFNPRQTRDWRGRWIAGGYQNATKGHFFIRKATREATNQGDTLSSGPRGSQGGSWSESTHSRDPNGKFAQQSSPERRMGKIKFNGTAPSYPKGGGGKKGKGGAKGKQAKEERFVATHEQAKQLADSWKKVDALTEEMCPQKLPWGAHITNFQDPPGIAIYSDGTLLTKDGYSFSYTKFKGETDKYESASQAHQDAVSYAGQQHRIATAKAKKEKDDARAADKAKKEADKAAKDKAAADAKAQKDIAVRANLEALARLNNSKDVKKNLRGTWRRV